MYEKEMFQRKLISVLFEILKAIFFMITLMKP